MQIELNQEFAPANTSFHMPSGGTMMITPPLDEDYWLLRVKLSDTQAIVAFPKFGTIGVGFAVEEDWNTNLPYTQKAENIFKHIDHNKGDDAISDTDCIAAIGMIQEAITTLLTTQAGRAD